MVSEPTPFHSSDSNSDSEGTSDGLSSPRSTGATTDPMSKNVGSSSRDPSKAGGPYGSTTGFEGYSVLIVTDKLNGSNYREWAQAIKLAIDGRGKLNFLTGAAKMPSETESQAFTQ